MDNPANPVFFNTFDPFDTPTPPSSNTNKSSSLTNSNVGSMSTGTPIPDMLTPANPSTINYLASPLDSPSINPYPLPHDSRSSFSPSPSPLPPPAYNSVPSPSNSYMAPSTQSSSVTKNSPVNSPSLSSSQTNYPQLQAPSPVPQQQVQQPLQFQAPSPVPQVQPPQYQLPQTQPTAFSPPTSQPVDNSHLMKFFPPSQPQPPAQPQPPQPQATQPPPQPIQPPSQSPPPQSSQSQSFLPTPQSPPLTSQSRDLLDQLNKNIGAVMSRLDSIENRLSFLEISTKEVLNNQRTIATQQRKLQDSVDTPKIPPPMPQQQIYEEPRKPQPQPQPQVYQPPMPTHISPPGPVIMPPPTHTHMPALVPVTHIPNRADVDYKVNINSSGRSSSSASQYDSDLELAKKLQAEFDASSTSSSTSSTSSSNSNSNTSSTSYPSKPAQSSQAKSGQQECPICQARVSIADLEAHVEQHFEDEEAKRAPLKPGEKPISKTEAKAGFFAKLFGPKPEDEKKATSTESTPAPATTPAATTSSTPATQVPYTHTTMSPAAYNQRMGYYPGMTASPGRPMYPSYYGYPVQNVPRNAQPQQYLYYPNLDQAPQ